MARELHSDLQRAFGLSYRTRQIRPYDRPLEHHQRIIRPSPPTPLKEVWQARLSERTRLAEIERELADLKLSVDLLKRKGITRQVEIHTFAPEPYKIKKPIPITIRFHDGEFLASFLDAGVSISGETEEEAFDAVKSLFLDAYEQLGGQAKLGPGLATSLAVLREFIDGP